MTAHAERMAARPEGGGQPRRSPYKHKSGGAVRLRPICSPPLTAGSLYAVKTGRDVTS